MGKGWDLAIEGRGLYDVLLFARSKGAMQVLANVPAVTVRAT